MNFHAKKLRTAAAFGALAVVGGVAGQVGQAVADKAPEPTPLYKAYSSFASDRSTAPGPADTARLASVFETFERGSNEADALRGPASPAVKARPFDTDQFRKVGSAQGHEVFAVPVHDGVCLSSASDLISGCLPSVSLPSDRSNGKGALSGLQVAICGPGLPGDRNAIYGLVPSGLKSFSLARQDGTVDEVAVEGNFVYYESPKKVSPVTEISWLAADGSTITDDSPFPKDFDESCGPTR